MAIYTRKHKHEQIVLCMSPVSFQSTSRIAAHERRKWAFGCGLCRDQRGSAPGKGFCRKPSGATHAPLAEDFAAFGLATTAAFGRRGTLKFASGGFCLGGSGGP